MEEKFQNKIISNNIYFNRELLTYSKERRRIDLITISSYDFITTTREPNLKDVFPYENDFTNFNSTSTTNLNNKNSLNNRSYSNLNFSNNAINNYVSLSLNKNQTNNINFYQQINLPNNNQNTNNINRSFQFSKEKPIVFITARVHPGETPASFLMNGIINFLLDPKDPRAEILRKTFVFKIIPLINVDGISRGYYRYDTNSLNMNRHYINPNPRLQPEIRAIKRLFMTYNKENRIRYYYDLHAHASSRGLFLFGNNLDFLNQVENCVLPKILEINCEFLLYNHCNFSEKSMKTKEKGDKFSKEGTGRVHFHKISDLIHCYTVEASYYRGLIKGNIPEISFIEDYYEKINLYGDEIDNNSYTENDNENKLNPLNNTIKKENINNNYEKIQEDKNSKLKNIHQILSKYYNFNLKQFITSKIEEKESDNHNTLNFTEKKYYSEDFLENENFLISTNQNLLNFKKKENKDNFINNCNSNMDFSPNSIIIKEKKIRVKLENEKSSISNKELFLESSLNFLQKKENNIISDNICKNRLESDNFPKMRKEDFSNLEEIKKENLYYTKDKNFNNYFNHHISNDNIYLNKNNNNIKLNGNIKKLLYENRFENKNEISNFPCLPDEEFYHTPVAYHKMGASLLIAILDYEGLNPFSRIFNSQYNSVEGVRENLCNIIINKSEKFRGNLLFSNLSKNIDNFKKFNSLYEKYMTKNVRSNCRGLVFKRKFKNQPPSSDCKNNSITISPLVNTQNNSTFNCNLQNNNTFIERNKISKTNKKFDSNRKEINKNVNYNFDEKDNSQKRSSNSEKFNLTNSIIKVSNINDNDKLEFNLNLDNFNKVTIPQIHKPNKSETKGKILFIYF